jgi:hypothetical protein
MEIYIYDDKIKIKYAEHSINFLPLFVLIK